MYHFFCHFIIFHDRRPSIFEAKHTYFFIRIGFRNHLGATDTAMFQHSSDKYRIRNLLQHIVHRKYIEPFHTKFFYRVQKSCAHHRNKPSAISIWRSRDTSFIFHINLSVIADRWCHLLNKEKYIFFFISKEFLFLKEFYGIFVVFFTCHNKERNPRSGLFDNIHNIMDQLLKQI